MRIIGGSHKGNRIKTRKGGGTRPLLARVKKSLFSIIQGYLVDATFLDLFAGFGGVGIEALSRGAAESVFVDLSEKCCLTIRKNLAQLGLADKGTVICKRVSTVLNMFDEEHATFDIIFVGAPYNSEYGLDTLERLGNSGLAHGESIVIVEVRKNTPLPEAAGTLRLARRKVYGDTALWFYHKGAPPEQGE